MLGGRACWSSLLLLLPLLPCTDCVLISRDPYVTCRPSEHQSKSVITSAFLDLFDHLEDLCRDVLPQFGHIGSDHLKSCFIVDIDGTFHLVLLFRFDKLETHQDTDKFCFVNGMMLS